MVVVDNLVHDLGATLAIYIISNVSNFLEDKIDLMVVIVNDD